MELTRFQKYTLIALGAMLVFFSALMLIFRLNPGVIFEESLLKISRNEDGAVYSGRAHGTPVTVTVTHPTEILSEVEFVIGTEFHDVFQVEYPLPTITAEGGFPVDGIRVTRNGALVFEGGYDSGRDEFARWYTRDGEWDVSFNIRGYSSSDPWNGYENTYKDAARFALGPDTSAHGDLALYVFAVIITAVAAVDVLFWRQLFRFNHRWARDPEPTEGYETLEHIGWVVLAVIAAGFYITALVKIY